MLVQNGFEGSLILLKLIQAPKNYKIIFQKGLLVHVDTTTLRAKPGVPTGRIAPPFRGDPSTPTLFLRQKEPGDGA